jgi:hypothetical protein
MSGTRGGTTITGWIGEFPEDHVLELTDQYAAR